MDRVGRGAMGSVRVAGRLMSRIDGHTRVAAVVLERWWGDEVGG